jgi:geranylgeranyl pyrophosphate synthase
MAEPERVDEQHGAAAAAVPLTWYRTELAECRERLRDAAADSGGAEVAAMVGEAKLLRATLVLASGSPLGASAPALMRAAVSIELLHLASLVHDDIIDEATERRGLPALHVTAGRSRALVVGDLLIVAAYDMLARARTTMSANVFARSVEALSTGARLCCLGQLEELAPRRHVVSETQYLDLVAKKTGALFSIAATLGALNAEADEDDVAALATFGTELGCAYQIRDDLRDGAEDAAGPARFSPTVATYARAVAGARGALARIPAPCDDPMRGLIEAMLGPPARP